MCRKIFAFVTKIFDFSEITESLQSTNRTDILDYPADFHQYSDDICTVYDTEIPEIGFCP